MMRKIDVPFTEAKVTSAGCLCLSRRVVQDKRVNFYPLRADASEDFGYCLWARDLGYKVYLDSTLELHHLIPKRIPKKPWLFDAKIGRCTPFFYGKNH